MKMYMSRAIYQRSDRQHKIYKWYVSCLVSWLYETHESSVQWRYFKMIFSKGQIIMTRINRHFLLAIWNICLLRQYIIYNAGRILVPDDISQLISIFQSLYFPSGLPWYRIVANRKSTETTVSDDKLKSCFPTF